jgi:hypothetical protein
MTKLLIDECLSPELALMARERRHQVLRSEVATAILPQQGKDQSADRLISTAQDHLATGRHCIELSELLQTFNHH